MKLAMKKWYNLCFIKSYGGVQNVPERLHQLKNKIKFSKQLTKIALLDQRDSQRDKYSIDTEMQALATAAKEKLVVKRNDVSKLTKKYFFPCSLFISK